LSGGTAPPAQGGKPHERRSETVDDDINSYLDDAGIPRPDHNDRMP
jgi:hypothetical protein